MTRLTTILCIVCIVWISACKEHLETGDSARDVIKLFEKALVNEDLTAAYGLMCPEYRGNCSAGQFARQFQTSPYLQEIRSLNCSLGSFDSSTAMLGINCYYVNQFGSMPSTIHVRNMKGRHCIVSMVVAGMPMIGAGCDPAGVR